MLKFEEIKPYKEKKWFKNDGSNQVITGFSLRGRQRMKPALKGLLEFLEKGETKTVGDTVFKILDVTRLSCFNVKTNCFISR